MVPPHTIRVHSFYGCMRELDNATQMYVRFFLIQLHSLLHNVEDKIPARLTTVNCLHSASQTQLNNAKHLKC